MAGGRSGKGSNLAAITVAALGYFVDVYDIWLYSILRKPSLTELGLDDAGIKSVGEALLNWQMAGFILGAIIFGVVADRKGRLTVLFGSILLYSVANIANGFVQDITQYSICRFVAGVGLAGELGAGIALVSELVSTKNRGWATTFIATVGVAGSVAAPLIATLTPWRTSYIIGGCMGLVLLVLRIGVFESGMFESVRQRDDVRKGDLRQLFANRDRIKRYLATILCGAPVWFFAGLMMTFSPELQKGLGLAEPIEAPKIVMISAIGLCVGDLIFGGLSQFFRSRKAAFFLAYSWMAIVLVAIFTMTTSTTMFYWLMFLGGVGAGFWAVFVTTAGEVFGTNLRGTVATTAPSFVRGLVIPMSLGRRALEPALGAIGATAALAAIVLVVAVWAVLSLPETYGRDMDFVES